MKTKPVNAWLLAVCAGFGLACLAPAAQLPSGPAGPGRFGAYHTWLAFSPEYDAPWRMGDRNDVVVRFDSTPARLVFWHGANFVPCWVNDKGTWSSDGAVLRPDAGPFNDRLCRFAFANVVESTEARVVVRWRYAPADTKGEVIHADPVTRWNDWVDEFYTIYPDATGVRKVTLHSSEWTQPYWIQQTLRIRQPGEAEIKSETLKSTSLKNGMIRWLDLKGSKPFMAVRDSVKDVAAPPAWGEWPAKGAAEHPSHHFVGAVNWSPASEDLNSKTWRMLTGLAGSEAEMKASAQGWLNAPALTMEGAGNGAGNYEPDQKAYLFALNQPGAGVKFSLAGSANTPVYNPAFVFKNWGHSDVQFTMNGKRLTPGADLRSGYRKTASGDDLIVWVRVSATKPTSFSIQAANNQGK